ncbi:hypothetical protein YB2330_000456 [Saitoella coloradoensis]
MSCALAGARSISTYFKIIFGVYRRRADKLRYEWDVALRCRDAVEDMAFGAAHGIPSGYSHPCLVRSSEDDSTFCSVTDSATTSVLVSCANGHRVSEFELPGMRAEEDFDDEASGVTAYYSIRSTYSQNVAANNPRRALKSKPAQREESAIPSHIVPPTIMYQAIGSQLGSPKRCGRMLLRRRGHYRSHSNLHKESVDSFDLKMKEKKKHESKPSKIMQGLKSAGHWLEYSLGEPEPEPSHLSPEIIDMTTRTYAEPSTTSDGVQCREYTEPEVQWRKALYGQFPARESARTISTYPSLSTLRGEW